MLDFYYQLLNVEKGASQKALKASFNRELILFRSIAHPNQKQRVTFALKEKAYEILSNVTVKRLYDAKGALIQMQFFPNPAYYKKFYDEINRKNEERYDAIREQEGKGVYFFFYRAMVLAYFLLSIVLIVSPILISSKLEGWMCVLIFICFSPLYWVVYFMWFKAFDYKKFEFVRPGQKAK